jgi:peptide chain release factor 1
MKAKVAQKLQMMRSRYQELAQLLAEPQLLSDLELFRNLSKEYAQLTAVVTKFNEYQQLLHSYEELQELLADSDKAMQELARAELLKIEAQRHSVDHELQLLLLPEDPNDNNNIFLEIRAGTGGDEASLFAGDLARMYLRYAETQNWQAEVIHESLGEYGGYKEIILRIVGKGVYAKCKFESGVHRVQRVPHTEAQGRIHTSTCTIAVLAELAAIEEVNINPAELRIDTFRASGAGGQHVNKTDSAIRITHLATGIVVECQDERSQHKNRARALSLLHTKIVTQQQEKQRQQQAETRRNLVGTGDRSERIRTYNFPQGRVTDHRINLTLYKLAAILAGDLDQLITVLVQEHQADLLASLE